MRQERVFQRGVHAVDFSIEGQVYFVAGNIQFEVLHEERIEMRGARGPVESIDECGQSQGEHASAAAPAHYDRVQDGAVGGGSLPEVGKPEFALADTDEDQRRAVAPAGVLDLELERKVRVAHQESEGGKDAGEVISEPGLKLVAELDHRHVGTDDTRIEEEPAIDRADIDSARSTAGGDLECLAQVARQPDASGKVVQRARWHYGELDSRRNEEPRGGGEGTITATDEDSRCPLADLRANAGQEPVRR